MKEIQRALQKPLEAHEIDFRVKQVIKNKATGNVGALLLAYKDARCDMNRLDQAVGPFGWKREHLRDNKNCIVSIWCQDMGQWISKEDTGNESNSDADKGLASDSFKRACFNWGIGRELYSYPLIWVNLVNGEFYERGNDIKASNKLRPNNWIWNNQFDSNGNITFLSAQDRNSTRFSWGNYKEVIK